jgi:hypothetical protein
MSIQVQRLVTRLLLIMIATITVSKIVVIHKFVMATSAAAAI